MNTGLKLESAENVYGTILTILDNCLDGQESITPEMLDSILSGMFDDEDEDYDDEDDF